MYQKIKDLADEAIALQNKGRMDAALREISELCTGAGQAAPEQSSDAAVDAETPGAKPAKKGGAK